MAGVSARATAFNGGTGAKRPMQALLSSTALVPAISIFAAAGLSVLPSAAQAQDRVIDGDEVVQVEGGTPSSPLNISGGLTIGGAGAGSLAITNGGEVSNSFGFVGGFSAAPGTVTVDGLGSKWTNSGTLVVGIEGTGSLAITNGGAVSNANSVLGNFATATGTVLVDGPDSKWTNSSTLAVGSLGTGRLEISNGGQVTALRVRIAAESGSFGTLTFGAAEGSAPTGAGRLTTSAVDFGGGTGTIVFNHTETDFEFAAAITGNGTLRQLAGTTIRTGASAFSGLTVISGGTFQIGNGGTTGMLGGGAVLNNAALVFNRADNITASNVISGTGSLTQRGGGTLTLAGANTYTGATRVEGGTLALGASNAISAGSALEVAGGTFAVNEFTPSVASVNMSSGSITGAAGSLLNVEGDYVQSGGALAAGATVDVGESGLIRLSGGTIAGTLNGLNPRTLFVGKVEGGSVLVTGRIALVGDLDVGNFGNGTLTINNGGVVSNDAGFVAFVSTESGTIRVDGAGSRPC